MVSRYRQMGNQRLKVLLVNYNLGTGLKIYAFSKQSKVPLTLIIPYYVFQVHFNCKSKVNAEEFQNPNVSNW